MVKASTEMMPEDSKIKLIKGDTFNSQTQDA